MTPNAEIDHFFSDPRILLSPPRAFSVLYLLRRDIDQCMGIDPNTGCKIKFEALWPGTMAILAGIDLLAKFYTGKNATGNVGERFEEFVREFFSLNQADAKTLYNLRNALLHSFGLYLEKEDCYFVLTAVDGGILVVRENNKCCVNLLTLHKGFECAISAYKSKLLESTDLQDKFSQIYKKYGTISISNSL